MPNLHRAAIAALSLAAAGPVASIPLKSGDYGEAGTACKSEPNAAIMSFDGRSFAYPHASQCTDRVTRRSAGTMTIVETCRALGDGSPAKADTQTFKLRPMGSDRFDLIKAHGSTTFRRCGALGYFNKH